MFPGVRRAAGLGAVCVLVNGCSLGVQGKEPPAQEGDPLTAEPEAGTISGTGDEDASPPARPVTHTDAGPAGHPASDAAAPDAGHSGPTAPNACTNATGPCVVVPSGWSLVAFAPAQTAACPAGFNAAPSQDLFEGPSAAGACTCAGCTVTHPPNCASGQVPVHYDTDFSGTCGTVANPSPLGNSPPGACGTDIYQGVYSSYDAEYTGAPGERRIVLGTRHREQRRRDVRGEGPRLPARRSAGRELRRRHLQADRSAAPTPRASPRPGTSPARPGLSRRRTTSARTRRSPVRIARAPSRARARERSRSTRTRRARRARTRSRRTCASASRARRPSRRTSTWARRRR